MLFEHFARVAVVHQRKGLFLHSFPFLQRGSAKWAVLSFSVPVPVIRALSADAVTAWKHHGDSSNHTNQADFFLLVISIQRPDLFENVRVHHALGHQLRFGNAFD